MKKALLLSRLRPLAAGLLPLSLVVPLFAGGCHGSEEPLGTGAAPLTAVCVQSAGEVPAGGWICGENEVVECDSHAGAHVDTLYVPVVAGGPLVCAAEVLSVSDPGPFPTGVHDITVDASLAGQPPSAFCHSSLTVVDTVPPQVTTHETRLWPPNHTYHHITTADCVTVDDLCDPAPLVWFTGASSDEPPNATGDGNTDPDIKNLGCDGVDLRAERQGPGDGRVYTLRWHAEDHAGHGVDGSCRVVVLHDQGGGAAVDSGEAYHADLPEGTCP